MIRKLLLTFLMTMCVIGASGMTAKALIVELTDGGKTTFVLSEQPMLTFEEHVLHITVNSQQTDFEMTAVKHFLFEEIDIDGISSNAADNLRIRFASRDMLVVEGFPKDSPIRLYATDGKQLSAPIAVRGTRAEISLRGLQKGIYFIQFANKQTLKIYRK